MNTMKDKEKKEVPVQENEQIPAEEVKETASGTEDENTAPEQETEKILDAASELAAMQEKYIYLQAEYQNYRKRMAKEISDSRRFAVEDTVQPFMKVYDFLAMAETAANQSDNMEAIRQGLIMIIAEYRKAFDELGLKAFDAKGEKFDPELHDAVARESSDEIPEGVVSKQWNCGFKLGEKVIRPARVVVSSGAAPEEGKKEE